jgi:hypothetical protein
MTSNNGMGIRLSSSNNSILNNTVFVSGASGYGIYSQGGDNNSVMNNGVLVIVSGGYGLYVDGNGNYIKNNSVNASSGIAISITGKFDVLANNSAVGGSGGYTIALSSASYVNVTNNTLLSMSGCNGLTLFDSSYINIMNNSISTSGSSSVGITLNGNSNWSLIQEAVAQQSIQQIV